MIQKKVVQVEFMRSHSLCYTRVSFHLLVDLSQQPAKKSHVSSAFSSSSLGIFPTTTSNKGAKKNLLMVPEQAQFLLANLDWATAELRDQNLVAGLHAGCDALSVLIEGAGADGNDFCFVEVLDGRLGEEDASCSLGFGLDALHKDAVEEGCNAADRLDGGLL